MNIEMDFDRAQAALLDFRKEFDTIPGISHIKFADLHGTTVIDVGFPFVFDKRQIPNQYKGIHIHKGHTDVLPEEFKVSNNTYIWVPENWERFVDRHTDEVRKKLGNLTMSREEMLDALFGGGFEDFRKQCDDWEREGKIKLS